MRDALGGVVNLVIIVVFITLVSGYLAFSVNYTKAFRVKNKIITTIENYEGYSSKAHNEIKNYAKSIGYNINTPRNFKANDWTGVPDCGFYYREITSQKAPSSGVTDYVEKKYYEVITFVTVDIPIINKIMPHIEFFQIKGTTKSITIK